MVSSCSERFPEECAHEVGQLPPGGFYGAAGWMEAVSGILHGDVLHGDMRRLQTFRQEL